MAIQTKKGRDSKAGRKIKTIKTTCLKCDKEFSSIINVYGRAAYRTCEACRESNANCFDRVFDEQSNRPIKYPGC